jgi:hypothetical protein
MIVDPDFLDHWKTRMLADTLNDELAPIYVIRLWGHCQTRRSWEFDIPANGVKALCRYPGDAEILDLALQSSGFISRQDGIVTVVGWDEHNASLIANWLNGKRGGRPKKANPTKTHGLPMDNPQKTHGEPIREDRIREDKIGLDYSCWPQQPAQQTLDDWIAMRKRLKANVSQTVINRFASELTKAVQHGYSVDYCLQECVTRNWRGFEFQWILNSGGAYANNQSPVGNRKPTRSENLDRAFEEAFGTSDSGAIEGDFTEVVINGTYDH